MVDVHARLLRRLEQTTGLDREIEFLPSEKTIAARRNDRRGLVSPELATLMAYGKIFLYAQLVESDLPEDPYLVRDLERYFPAPLPERFAEHIGHHRLRRELIATIVANQLVDRAGMTFAFRLAEETGAERPSWPAPTRSPATFRHAQLLGGGRGAGQPDRGRDPARRC